MSWFDRIANVVRAPYRALPDGEQLLGEIEAEREVFDPLADPAELWDRPRLSAVPISSADRPSPDVEPPSPAPSGDGHPQHPLTDIELAAIRRLIEQHFPGLGEYAIDLWTSEQLDELSRRRR